MTRSSPSGRQQWLVSATLCQAVCAGARAERRKTDRRGRGRRTSASLSFPRAECQGRPCANGFCSLLIHTSVSLCSGWPTTPLSEEGGEHRECQSPAWHRLVMRRLGSDSGPVPWSPSPALPTTPAGEPPQGGGLPDPRAFSPLLGSVLLPIWPQSKPRVKRQLADWVPVTPRAPAFGENGNPGSR